MKTAALLAIVGITAAAAPAAAQFSRVQPAPKTWISASATGYLDPGRVVDATGSWSFDPAFGLGLGVHRRVGQSLMLGFDGSYAPADYKSTDAAGAEIERGSARLMTGLVSARLRYSGGEGLGMYLTGGAGAFAYSMPDVDRMDADPALLAGAGLEYRMSPRHAVYLEWGRFWTFHQNEDVGSNSTKHQNLRVGGRLGF